RRVRHPQPARGARAVHPRRRHDRAARPHQERARAPDAVPARHGVVRAGGPAREAVERHPRRISARDGRASSMKVLAIRVAIVVALLGAWEIVGRTANPLLYVPPSAAVPALGRLLARDSYPDLAEHLLLTLREILSPTPSPSPLAWDAASRSASTGWWAARTDRSWPRSTRCPPSSGTRRS